MHTSPIPFAKFAFIFMLKLLAIYLHCTYNSPLMTLMFALISDH